MTLVRPIPRSMVHSMVRGHIGLETSLQPERERQDDRWNNWPGRFNSWQGLFAIKQETTAQDIAMGDTPFIAKHTRTDWSQ